MKLLPQMAIVEQATLQVSVTSAQGGAGQAIADTRATTLVKLTNLSTDKTIGYKVGSGAWVDLTESDTVDLPVNLATTTVYLRKSGRVDATTPVQVDIDLASVAGQLGSGNYPGLPTSTGAALTTAQVAALTADLDAMVVGPITRDTNGAATSAALVGGGQYTALVLSTAFPGAVDSYRCVYGSTTYTQPTVTRDANGAVINRPALVVS